MRLKESGNPEPTDTIENVIAEATEAIRAVNPRYVRPDERGVRQRAWWLCTTMFRQTLQRLTGNSGVIVNNVGHTIGNNVEYKRQPKANRYLMEGGVSGEWRIHFTSGEAPISYQAGVLMVNGYRLSLVGILEEGQLRPLQMSDPETEVELGIDTVEQFMMRPRTLMTDDSRVFHDLNLRNPDRDEDLLEVCLDIFRQESDRVDRMLGRN